MKSPIEKQRDADGHVQFDAVYDVTIVMASYTSAYAQTRSAVLYVHANLVHELTVSWDWLPKDYEPRRKNRSSS